MDGYRRKRKGAKSRARSDTWERIRTQSRSTSNVFSMFDKKQITELKEVFNMIDQDCDGFIDKTDLLETFDALGETTVSTEYVEEMMKESPSYINLTMFLTLFGNKLNGTDPDDTLVAAFSCLDVSGTGKIHGNTLKKLLTEKGDKFSDEEMSLMLADTNMDDNGCFDYAEFVQLLKYGRTL